MCILPCVLVMQYQLHGHIQMFKVTHRLNVRNTVTRSINSEHRPKKKLSIFHYIHNLLSFTQNFFRFLINCSQNLVTFAQNVLVKLVSTVFKQITHRILVLPLLRTTFFNSVVRLFG